MPCLSNDVGTEDDATRLFAAMTPINLTMLALFDT